MNVPPIGTWYAVSWIIDGAQKYSYFSHPSPAKDFATRLHDEGLNAVIHSGVITLAFIANAEVSA